jgi:hypothetical protein
VRYYGVHHHVRCCATVALAAVALAIVVLDCCGGVEVSWAAGFIWFG